MLECIMMQIFLEMYGNHHLVIAKLKVKLKRLTGKSADRREFYTI